MKQTAPCPKCGNTYGWWEKRCQSYFQYFDEIGKPTHSADGETMGRGGKRKFCSECNKDITDLIR